MIKIKRIYEVVEESDGVRILVDRLWPRGISKSKAKIALWLKDVAPSDKLRKWFAHDPKRWKDFQKKYTAELKNKEEILSRIKQIEEKEKVVTVLYAAKDEKHNNAVALKNILRHKK